MTGEKRLESWEKCREVGNLAKSWSRMVWMGGGGGFLSEAGLRERAQAQGRVFWAGGEGVRIWAFWLWDFGIIRNLRLNLILVVFTVYVRML